MCYVTSDWRKTFEYKLISHATRGPNNIHEGHEDLPEKEPAVFYEIVVLKKDH